jgi:hypothetical protein
VVVLRAESGGPELPGVYMHVTSGRRLPGDWRGVEETFGVGRRDRE